MGYNADNPLVLSASRKPLSDKEGLVLKGIFWHHFMKRKNCFLTARLFLRSFSFCFAEWFQIE